jgi:hypothetical protein
VIDVGIGASLFLIAAGAILAWAVRFEAAGINVNAVGVILMVVGLIGLALSLMVWRGLGRARRRGEHLVVEDHEIL